MVRGALSRWTAAIIVVLISSGLLLRSRALLPGLLIVFRCADFHLGWSPTERSRCCGHGAVDHFWPRYVATSLGMVVGLGDIGRRPLLALASARVNKMPPFSMMIMAVCAVVGTVLALFLRETAPIRWRSRPA